LFRALAMHELVKEMEKYSIDICVMQEISWPGKGTVIKRILQFYVVGIKVTNMNLE